MAANLLHATRRGGLRRTSPSCRTCCGPNAAVYLPIPCCKETAASRWPLTVASRDCVSCSLALAIAIVSAKTVAQALRMSSSDRGFRPIATRSSSRSSQSSAIFATRCQGPRSPALLEHLRHQRSRDHAASGDDAGDGLPQSRPSPSIAHKAAPPCARGLAPVLGIEKFIVPHRCTSARAVSIRGTNAPARWTATWCSVIGTPRPRAAAGISPPFLRAWRTTRLAALAGH
jgi:hypothetical protein